MIINELEHAKNSEYRTTLMAFINCLIISAPSAMERVSIRDEFIALKLLDMIANMRCDARGELLTQIELFDEQRSSDDNVDILDVNSHQDVFFAILKQISGRSQYEIPFLHILQHLLTIDYSKFNDDNCAGNNVPTIIWNTVETLVHRATTMIECQEDAGRLLRLHLRRQSSFDISINSKMNNTSCQTTPSDPHPPPIPAPRSSSRPLSPEAKQEPGKKVNKIIGNQFLFFFTFFFCRHKE